MKMMTYYAVRRVSYYKVRQFCYKVWQLLQSPTILIIKWDSYYKCNNIKKWDTAYDRLALIQSGKGFILLHLRRRLILKSLWLLSGTSVLSRNMRCNWHFSSWFLLCRKNRAFWTLQFEKHSQIDLFFDNDTIIIIYPI